MLQKVALLLVLLLAPVQLQAGEREDDIAARWEAVREYFAENDASLLEVVTLKDQLSCWLSGVRDDKRPCLQDGHRPLLDREVAKAGLAYANEFEKVYRSHFVRTQSAEKALLAMRGLITERRKETEEEFKTIRRTYVPARDR